MSLPDFKSAALTATIIFGLLVSHPAHAAILRSGNGMPVLTKDGACVVTNWEGENGCEAAKKVAGLDRDSLPTPCPPAAEEGWTHQEKTVYFDFNKSALTPGARHHLDRLEQKLRRRKASHAPNLTIVGYADRLGNADYNQILALKRAEAVRNYLLADGVVANKVEVRSLGKTVPKADCSADLPRVQMIACLREDRRVEIDFSSGGK